MSDHPRVVEDQLRSNFKHEAAVVEQLRHLAVEQDKKPRWFCRLQRRKHLEHTNSIGELALAAIQELRKSHQLSLQNLDAGLGVKTHPVLPGGIEVAMEFFGEGPEELMSRIRTMAESRCMAYTAALQKHRFMHPVKPTHHLCATGETGMTDQKLTYFRSLHSSHKKATRDSFKLIRENLPRFMIPADRRSALDQLHHAEEAAIARIETAHLMLEGEYLANRKDKVESKQDSLRSVRAYMVYK